MAASRRIVLYLLGIAPDLFAQSMPKRSTALWRRLLRIAGISANPAGLRDGTLDLSGDLWLASRESKPAARRLTTEGGYRSPVFEPDGAGILAIRGDRLVRLAIPSGLSRDLCLLPETARLVGFDPDSPGELVVVRRASGVETLIFALDLKSGNSTPVPHQPKSEDDELISYLLGSERDYGNLILSVREVEKSTLAGTRAWTDVFLRERGRPAEINVSQCAGVNCGQPALSPDGTTVVFVRSLQND